MEADPLLINMERVLSKYAFLFVKGLGVTLVLSLITVAFGVVIGSLFCLMRISKVKPLSWLATAYVEVIRGTPLLLQLYFFYFLLPKMLPFINMSTFFSISLALVINSSAYVAEIIRSGIQAVDRGQGEAARSLGLNARQTMTRIILPQAVKNILPALCNEFVVVIKETSLSSTFFLGDLMTVFKNVNGALFLTIEPLMIVGVIYFLVTFTLSKGISALERRLKAGD